MNYLRKVWFILSSSYKSKSVVIFFLIIISTFLEVLGIGLIVPIIIMLLDEDILTKYPLIYQIVSHFYDQPNKIDYIKFGLFCLLGVYFIKNFFLVFFTYYESKFTWGARADISKRLFEYYINEELSFHSKKNSAYLINNITKEIAVFMHVLFHLITFFTEILIFIGVSLLLIYYQPMGFLIISTISILVIAIYNLITSNKLSELGQQRQEQDNLLLQKIQQGLGGIREIKIYNRETSFLKTFQKSNYKLHSIFSLHQIISKLPKLLLEFSAVFALTVVVFVLLNLDFSNNYIITILGLFVLAASRILPSLMRMYASIQMLKYGFPATELLYNECLRIKEIKAKNNSEKNSTKNISGILEKKLSFNNSIKVQDVTFSYSNNGEKIFNNVNFDIIKGRSIGIQGPSGSGKSTLVDILLGLLKPNHGKVLVDNINIHENLLSWQKKVSYVPQTVFLTDDKLKRNIAFGLDDENIDNKKLQEAVVASELEDFVKSLPDGLETVIGERGARLSGGQRQRIGLARALYHNPELLVLDETTSSLESEIEKRIVKTISKIQKNKTIIIISHNENLLKHCDIIYLIQNKKILKK